MFPMRLKKGILVSSAWLAILWASSVVLGQESAPAPSHRCDQLAANPLDPQRVGPGVQTSDIQPRQAIPACEAAVALFPNELRFQFQLGRAYRQAGRFSDDLIWYGASANSGYPGAQNSLGVMYSRSEGVKQDCDLAAYWIGLAAEQGYPAAIRNLRILRCVQVVNNTIFWPIIQLKRIVRV